MLRLKLAGALCGSLPELETLLAQNIDHPDSAIDAFVQRVTLEPRLGNEEAMKALRKWSERRAMIKE
jgi:hypothetical protein